MGDASTFNKELGSAMYTPRDFWQQTGVFGGQQSPASMSGLTVSGVTPPVPSGVTQSFFTPGAGQPSDPNVFRFMGPNNQPVDFNTQTYQALYGGLPGFAGGGGGPGGGAAPAGGTVEGMPIGALPAPGPQNVASPVFPSSALAPPPSLNTAGPFPGPGNVPATPFTQAGPSPTGAPSSITAAPWVPWMPWMGAGGSGAPGVVGSAGSGAADSAGGV